MTLRVGNLEAKKGEKTQGYLKIINTNISVPCTLINGLGKKLKDTLK